MLIGIIISLLLGILAGAFTGLMPGIHINLVGVLLVSLSASLFRNINPVYLVVFIASMSIAHTFVDFIPSIFLGCPDTDTGLSILPGHELLKQGKGYEAVMLTSKGGLVSVFVLILVSFPLAFLISKIYDAIHSVMFYILLATFLLLILAEKKKFTALFVFIVSGLLGLSVLNSGVSEPLFPMLTGLFGTSMLVISIREKIQIPQQEITKPKINFFKPVLGAIIASPLCGFLPGLGSGQAAVLGSAVSKTDNKGFLVLIGAVNILVMGLSFVSLYAISKTRTGSAAAIQEIIGVLSWKVLIIILLAVLISGIVSFFLTGFLVRKFSQLISHVNYTKLSMAIIILLTILVFVFSGFLGLLILAASTFTGVYCNSLAVKKTHMMGCLLIPTILFYFLEIIY